MSLLYACLVPDKIHRVHRERANGHITKIREDRDDREGYVKEDLRDHRELRGHRDDSVRRVARLNP